MRCTRIDKYKCRVSVDWKLTNHKVRLIWDLLHIHVVHCGLLVVGWLQHLLLRTVVCIMSLLTPLEACHLTQILLHKVAITVAVMSTVSSRVVSVSSLVVVAVALLAIMAMSIASMVVAVMASMVPMVTPSMLGVSFIRSARLVVRTRVVIAALSLAVFHLLVLPFQDPGLVHKLQESGAIDHQ